MGQSAFIPTLIGRRDSLIHGWSVARPPVFPRRLSTARMSCISAQSPSTNIRTSQSSPDRSDFCAPSPLYDLVNSRLCIAGNCQAKKGGNIVRSFVCGIVSHTTSSTLVCGSSFCVCQNTTNHHHHLTIPKSESRRNAAYMQRRKLHATCQRFFS